MRFSVRAKKILLYLQKVETEEPDRNSRAIRGMVGETDAPRESPWGTKWWPIDSCRRTARQLVDKGYLRQRRGYKNFVRYTLTDQGREKAQALRTEYLDLIDEWESFVKY